MKINLKGFIIPFLIFINLSCATMQGDIYYRQIIEEAKSTNTALTFMKLKNYLQENPDSIHRQEIMFALSEYYLEINDYRDAIEQLTEYISEYPQEKNTVFIKVFLYKALLEYKDEPLLVEKLKENFFSKSIFLVFSDSKTSHYKSILNNNYKIVEYVDKIEIFKNNELFLKIAP